MRNISNIINNKMRAIVTLLVVVGLVGAVNLRTQNTLEDSVDTLIETDQTFLETA